MALPSRNRRNVTVDGIHYHWVKGLRGDNGRGMVTVQHANGTGSKLMIDPHGWNPFESGPPFCIGFADRISTESRFVLRCATDPPYWMEFDELSLPDIEGR